MRIEFLAAEGFRNLEAAEFSPCAGMNVIRGGNAQGKTNLLEAVWLFSGARSFRGAKDADYIGFGRGRAALDLTFHAGGRKQDATLVYGGEKKAFSLNGVKLDRIAQLAGEFCAVVFSPDHLFLIKEGPEKRRKMIDASLCQALPRYAGALDGYERALKHRNRLLRDIPLHSSLLDTLDVWDLQIIEYGAYISWTRARYLARLAEFAAEAYDGISSGKERYSVRYVPSFGEDGETVGILDKQICRARLEAALRGTRSADLRLGSTSAGPHRDDIAMELDGVSARTFGSQGQQRSCVLALKLAECRILEESRGEPPVVLLDDVMSELDDSRRLFLLNQLTGRQVLLTCCDPSSYAGMEAGSVFTVRAGRLEGE